MSAFSKGKPRLWKTLQDSAGVSWSVYIGDAESIPQLEGSWGITLPEQGLVGIQEGNREMMNVTLLHELLHVCLSLPGDGNSLWRLFQCKEDEVRAVEENIVAFLAPRLYGLLHGNGMLRLPAVPK
jgi:hypothetical protein